MSVTLLLLGVTVAILAVSAMGVQVPLHRELTIAIIDSHRNSPAREHIELKVASMVRKAVSTAFRNEAHVQLVIANAADAKAKLNRRVYDAALVMGEDRPSALRRLNLVTMAATLLSDAGYEPVSWMMPDGDSEVNAKLRAAFSDMIAENSQTVTGGRGPIDPMPNGSEFAQADQ